MFLAAPQVKPKVTQGAWPVPLFVWICGLVLGCSPRSSTGDATGAADAVQDAGFDVLGDGADSIEVVADEGGGAPKAEIGDGVETDLGDGWEVGDAITDASDGGGGGDLDVGPGDVWPPEDATAVDGGVPCTSTDIPAALTGTVEFDFSPLVPNPVVMGCGKGAPKPVKTGTPCCDCPPPYSCYCDGECGWLRAPDLVKPQHDGQAVWTGKWVVSLGEAYGKYLKPFTTTTMPGDMNLQRWQPGSGKGFEVVKLPSPDFPTGNAVLYVLGEQVVVAVRYWGSGKIAYSPWNPIYLYDPEANIFTKIDMPYCGKLLLSGTTLGCVAAWQSGEPGQEGGLQIYDVATGTWTLVQPTLDVVGNDWACSYPTDAVADSQSVYLIGAITKTVPWPDGTPGWPGPGHILKYELKTQKWSDIGFVPVDWEGGRVTIDHVGIVKLKGTIQAARFRLDTFKWELAPAVLYSWQYGQQEPLLVPCGLLFGSGHVGSALGGGMAYRPLLMRSDLSWELLPPWGYPNDAKTSRHSANFVLTDKELIGFGGMNGPPDGAFVYHKDSYRYPLWALCKKGASK